MTYPLCLSSLAESCSKGPISHSQAFKNASDYEGKSVLVLGAGTTAADTACELVRHAKHVYFSNRHGNLIMKRLIGGHAP
jgi:dimethylaniline monooxygenase (N-oxide forming)